MINLWIDLINPSDVQFFKSLISDLSEYTIHSTTRNRAETVELANHFNIPNQVIGTDYNDSFRKSVNMIYRTIDLAVRAPTFDVSLSFENGMCTFASKLRGKASILYCDNDLKFIQKKTIVQDLETKIKTLADYTIIPAVCYNNFKKVVDDDKLRSFDGYKEHIYIADYKPAPNFLNELPFEEFIVIRPEALFSIYVKDMNSIVPELLAAFIRDGINVVYLPREGHDVRHADGMDVFVPKKTLNGLDFCYYADAILTGSGTLAREAACMGTPAVSFFPSDVLLSVDQQLVDESKIFHSRDVEEIADYVISHHKKNEKMDFEGCKKVKREVIKITKDILQRIKVK
jgi:predicted glycosyltransferase